MELSHGVHLPNGRVQRAGKAGPELWCYWECWESKMRHTLGSGHCIYSVFGFCLSGAHQMFDEMAARKQKFKF